jgi:hypothetical protein
VNGDAGKVMFEVYRECGFNRRYHVVYFTELEEDERDAAIDAALAGECFFHGYIDSGNRDAAKQVLDTFVARLNDGTAGTVEELQRSLARFLT